MYDPSGMRWSIHALCLAVLSTACADDSGAEGDADAASATGTSGTADGSGTSATDSTADTDDDGDTSDGGSMTGGATTDGRGTDGSGTDGPGTDGSDTEGPGTDGSDTEDTGGADTGGVCGGLLQCDGACVDSSLDPDNCGGCDNPCDAGEVCSNGRCGLQCSGGTTECGGLCVDTDLDPTHCGDCGRPCGADEVCSDGLCGLSCVGGTTECGGLCVDTDLDVAHCGDCDDPCTVGEVCSEGLCGLLCAGGTTECGGGCSDTTIDDAHCGECDNPCGLGDFCLASTCVRITTLSATNRGWWRDDGFHESDNNNTVTGELSGEDYNSYFSFDLSTVTGTVFEVTLVLEHVNSVGGNQDLSVWDVATDELPLEATGSDVGIWSDLETGNSYGSFFASPATMGTTISTALDAQAVADVQANLGGGFSVGVSCDNCVGTAAALFSFGDEVLVHRLLVTHEP